MGTKDAAMELQTLQEKNKQLTTQVHHLVAANRDLHRAKAELPAVQATIEELRVANDD
jgi:hypothetical protein